MSGIPRSNKFGEQIKSIIGNFHILLSLLRDLNVTLFKFYPTHWCFSTDWIFKGFRSQVITTSLEMETCNIRQKYMPSIYILSKPFFTSQLTLSHQAQGPPNWHSISASHCPHLSPFHLLHVLIPLCLAFQKYPVCVQASLSLTCNASASPLWPRIHILPSTLSFWRLPLLSCVFVYTAFPWSLARSYSQNKSL